MNLTLISNGLRYKSAGMTQVILIKVLSLIAVLEYTLIVMTTQAFSNLHFYIHKFVYFKLKHMFYENLVNL